MGCYSDVGYSLSLSNMVSLHLFLFMNSKNVYVEYVKFLLAFLSWFYTSYKAFTSIFVVPSTYNEILSSHPFGR